MATLGLQTSDQGCHVRCDGCDSQPKVLVDIESVSGFCFYCDKGTAGCLRQVGSTKWENNLCYCVFGQGVSDSVSFDDPKLFVSFFLEIFF